MLASILADERQRAGFSSREAGKLIGLNKSTILRHESGKRFPTLKSLFLYNEYYEIPISTLFNNLLRDKQDYIVKGHRITLKKYEGGNKKIQFKNIINVLGGKTKINMDSLKEVGSFISKKRRTTGMTVDGLCNKTKISYGTLSSLESGCLKGSPYLFSKLCKTLDINFNFFMNMLLVEKLKYFEKCYKKYFNEYTSGIREKKKPKKIILPKKYNLFGQKIKSLRESRYLTRSQISVDIFGIKHNNSIVKKVEDGRYFPCFEHVNKLALYFGVNRDYLFNLVLRDKIRHNINEQKKAFKKYTGGDIDAHRLFNRKFWGSDCPDTYEKGKLGKRYYTKTGDFLKKQREKMGFSIKGIVRKIGVPTESYRLAEKGYQAPGLIIIVEMANIWQIDSYQFARYIIKEKIRVNVEYCRKIWEEFKIEEKLLCEVR